MSLIRKYIFVWRWLNAQSKWSLLPPSSSPIQTCCKWHIDYSITSHGVNYTALFQFVQQWLCAAIRLQINGIRGLSRKLISFFLHVFRGSIRPSEKFNRAAALCVTETDTVILHFSCSFYLEWDPAAVLSHQEVYYFCHTAACLALLSFLPHY